MTQRLQDPYIDGVVRNNLSITSQWLLSGAYKIHPSLQCKIPPFSTKEFYYVF